MASRLTHCVAAFACAAMLATAAHAEESPTPDPLTLPDAFDLAMQIHPDLRVAGANLAVARADSLFARVRAFNPEVQFQTSRGGRSLGSGSESSLELGVSQELELPGQRDARQSVATARSRTSAAEWSVKLQEIESDIRAKFERVLFLQDRLVTLDELESLDRHVAISSQARVRDGSITPLTGRLTELDLLRLEAQGRRTRADYRQALVGLGLAIGRPLPASIRLSGALDADSLQASEDSLVSLALRVRGEGALLRRQIEARRAELVLDRQLAKPNLTVGAGLTREHRSLSSDDFSGDPAIVRGISGARSTDNLWTARVSVPLPLWQKNQAGRARASAELARSQADYDRYRVRTQLEVLAAARRFQDVAGLYRLYLGHSTRVREDLVLIREAYADGRIPLDSYLTQKGRLVDTLIGQLEAADAYWDARGELEAAVGLDLAHLNAGGER